MHCVSRFAPEKSTTPKDKTNDWITNKTRFLNERNCFTSWMIIRLTKFSSVENTEKVCSMITETKNEANYKKLGVKPTAKTNYWTLKILENNQNTSPNVLDPIFLNEKIVSIGPLLWMKLPAINLETKVWRPAKSKVFQRTDKPEVKKVIQLFKN